MFAAARVRFLTVFALACVAGVYAHEIGHAVAAWLQGIAMVPMPVKSYTLGGHVGAHQQAWISFGGVAATTVVVVAAFVWYARTPRPAADAVLAGVLVPLTFYAVRFALAGRGHDGLEWQEAQSALGVAFSGHAVDVLFLVLWGGGVGLWIGRRRSTLRPASVAKALALMLAGVVILAVLQVVNNAALDPLFR